MLSIEELEAAKLLSRIMANQLDNDETERVREQIAQKNEPLYSMWVTQGYSAREFVKLGKPARGLTERSSASKTRFYRYRTRVVVAASLLAFIASIATGVFQYNEANRQEEIASQAILENKLLAKEVDETKRSIASLSINRIVSGLSQATPKREELNDFDYLDDKTKISVASIVSGNHLRDGRVDSAEEWLEKVKLVGADSDPHFLNAKGLLLESQGKTEEGLPLLQESVDICLSQPSFSFDVAVLRSMNLARLYYEQRNLENAIAAINNLEDKHGSEIDLHPKIAAGITYAKAKLLRSIGKYLEAVDVVEDRRNQFLIIGKIEPGVLAMLEHAEAMGNAGAGNTEGALKSYEKLSAMKKDGLAKGFIDSVWADVTLMAATLYDSRGDNDEAKRIVKEFAKSGMKTNSRIETRLAFANLMNSARKGDDRRFKSQLEQLLKGYRTEDNWPRKQLEIYATSFMIAGDFSQNEKRGEYWDVACKIIDQNDIKFNNPIIRANVGRCILAYTEMPDQKIDANRLARLRQQGQEWFDMSTGQSWDYAMLQNSALESQDSLPRLN